MIKQVIRFFPIFVDIAVLLLLFCLNLLTNYTLKKLQKKLTWGQFVKKQTSLIAKVVLNIWVFNGRLMNDDVDLRQQQVHVETPFALTDTILK